MAFQNLDYFPNYKTGGQVGVQIKRSMFRWERSRRRGEQADVIIRHRLDVGEEVYKMGLGCLLWWISSLQRPEKASRITHQLGKSNLK